MPGITVAELARVCEGEAEGNLERMISGANALENASENELSFAANAKAAETAMSSHAGCLLVPLSFDKQGAWSIIRVENPRLAFARALTALYPKKMRKASRHPTAIIAATAELA